MILPGDTAESIAAAACCIRTGGLLGFPTETVYGLAADADNDTAVAQIFASKGRPVDHPLIVHVASSKAVEHYASNVPEFARQLMQAFWPGPLTLILPRRPGVANAAAGGNPTIGLRCPAHPVAQALLNWGQMPVNLAARLGTAEPLKSDCIPFVWGLAAPSANQFGRVSPTTAQHVKDEFGAELLVLDGGPCSVGIESTIIDCTRGVLVLLRPGAITQEQVQAACGSKVFFNQDLIRQNALGPKASGTLASHYAPRAKVQLMDAPALQAALHQLAAQPTTLTRATAGHTSPAVAVWSRTSLAVHGAQIIHEMMPSNAATTAQQLFATLRALDAQGVKQIWIETPPANPEWDGVRDRLQRAAH